MGDTQYGYTSTGGAMSGSHSGGNQPVSGYGSSYDYNSSYNYGSSAGGQGYGANNAPVSSNQQWQQQSSGYSQSSDQYSYSQPHYPQQSQSTPQYNYSGSQYGAPPSASNQGGYNVPPPSLPPPPPPPTGSASGGSYPGPGSGGPYGGHPPSGYHDNMSAPQGMRNQPPYRGGLGGGRSSGPGYNKGPRGGYSGGGGGYQQQHEEVHDTVFVSGLPEDATESQIAEYFGSIGIIKNDKKTGKAKIWIYKDKDSGKSKGEATVTYDDPPTANSSITWFNGKEFRGAKIKVELAQRKPSMGGFGGRGSRGGPGGGGGGRPDRGGYGGYGSGGPGHGPGNRSGPPPSVGRQGDWICPNPSCKNNNFSWRTQCNRCSTDKPDGMGPPGHDEGGPMVPQVVDGSRRNGAPGMRGGGGRGGRGGMGGGFGQRGRGGGGPGMRGGRGGGPSGRGRAGGPMRGSGGPDRRSAPY